MSPVTRFTDLCVLAAARRWPAGLGDLMATEWRAELAHARRDPGAGRLARIWRQLAFALSLALSPAAGSESPITPRWRTRLTGFGAAGQRLVALIGVAMLAYLLPDMLAGAWDFATQQNEGGGPIFPIWLNTTATAVLTVLALIAMVFLGRFMARRLPPPANRGSRQAAGVAVQLGAGFLLTYLIANVGTYNTHNTRLIIVVSIVLWTGCAAILTGIGARVARSGHVARARTITAIGLLVITDAAAIASQAPTVLRYHLSIASGPLWLPVSMARSTYFSATAHRVIDLVNDAVRADMLPLLLISAFLVTYAVRRRAEATAVEPVVQETTTAGAPWASRPVRAYALALAAAGLALWTVMLAFGGPGRDPFTEGTYLTAIRMVAIACMVLALVIYSAGRGPVAAPAALCGGVLFAADHVVGVHGWHGPWIVAGLVVMASAVLIGAASLVPLLAGPGTTETSARRALVVSAITAVFAVPTAVQWLLLNTMRMSLTQTQGGHPYPVISSTALVVLTLGGGLLLTVTGLVAAVASRRERLSPSGVVIATIAVGALYAAGTINDSSRSLLYFPQTEFFIQPVIAAALIVIARWPRPGHRVRALVWAVAGCVGAAIGAVAMFNSVDDVNRLLAGVVPDMFVTGRASLNVVPHLAVGLVLALVFAKRLIPPPEPADADDPRATPVTLSPAAA